VIQVSRCNAIMPKAKRRTMSSDEFPESTAQQPNPEELLAKLVQLLQSIYDLQLEQQKEIRQILASVYKEQIEQSEQLKGVIETIQNIPEELEVDRRVVIDNFDMPFMAIVGFIIKFTLASIPAAIILTIFVVIMLAVLASCGVRP
jgi:hypothetical protein